MNTRSPHFMPSVANEIFELRPDYAAISVIANGICNVASHPMVDRYVADALTHPSRPSWAEGHLEAWRAAYRAFGAKPQRTPCSAEALLTRFRNDGKLPAINAVVDLYNAISVRYAIPIGGENVEAYMGNPRLVRASGVELFDTMKDGQPVADAVPPGEVVWMDGRRVTCRRWNWRQGLRTRIELDTGRAWFVLELLEPMSMNAGMEAAVSLMETLRLMSPEAEFAAYVTNRAGTTDVKPEGKSPPRASCPSS